MDKSGLDDFVKALSTIFTELEKMAPLASPQAQAAIKNLEAAAPKVVAAAQTVAAIAEALAPLIALLPK